MPQETRWALGPSDRVSNQLATGNYEVIERLEPPVQPPDPKTQAAEKQRQRRRIAAPAHGVVIAFAGPAARLWRRRHRGLPAG